MAHFDHECPAKMKGMVSGHGIPSHSVQQGRCCICTAENNWIACICEASHKVYRQIERGKGPVRGMRRKEQERRMCSGAAKRPVQGTPQETRS